MNSEFNNRVSELRDQYTISCPFDRIADMMTEDIVNGNVVHEDIIRQKEFSDRSFEIISEVQEGDLFAIDSSFSRLIYVDPENEGKVHVMSHIMQYIPHLNPNAFVSRLVLKCVGITNDYIKCQVFGLPAYKSGTHEIWILKTDDGNYSLHSEYYVKSIASKNPYYTEYLISLQCAEQFKSYRSESDEMAQEYFKIAEEVYPGMVDTYSRFEDGLMPEVKLEGKNKYSIIIHFPELEVTNKNALSHKVKDLYVAITLDRNGYVVGFYGCRMTLEAKEINTSYGMSHCSNGMGTWSGWCTGSGDFATSKSILRNEYNPELFEIWLTQLRYYLEWESLSGGPYRRIEQAIRGSITSGSNHISSRDIKKFVEDIIDWQQDVNRFFVATINDYGMGQTDISISGSRDLATTIFNLSANEREEIFKRYNSALVDNQALDSVSETGDLLGVLKLDLAKKIAEEKKNMSNLTFPFQEGTVEFKTYVNETLYQESYEAPILDLNKQIKQYIEAILSKKVMYHLIDDIKQTAKSNTEYDEFKQQNREFPEEILTCTTVY